MKVCVLGGGSWGTALAKVLNENGHDVKVWMRNKDRCAEINNCHVNKKYLPKVELPRSLIFSTDIDDCLNSVKFVLLAIPTQNIRSVLKNLKDEYKEDKVFINVAKGIEIGTDNLISEIIAEETNNSIYVVLSGPSHAEEVGLKLPTVITSACSDISIAKRVQDLFMNDYLRIYTNNDVRGVELGGALKNIIALGAGISDGVGFGDNAKAALITRGITEITRLGLKLGAKDSTFAGLSGLGDLIVTCTSNHSRNRRCGFLIGQGYTKEDAVSEVGMVVEGITTTIAAYEISKKLNIDMPIVEAMYEIVENGVDVNEAVKKLMNRDKKGE